MSSTSSHAGDELGSGAATVHARDRARACAHAHSWQALPFPSAGAGTVLRYACTFWRWPKGRAVEHGGALLAAVALRPLRCRLDGRNAPAARSPRGASSSLSPEPAVQVFGGSAAHAFPTDPEVDRTRVRRVAFASASLAFVPTTTGSAHILDLYHFFHSILPLAWPRQQRVAFAPRRCIDIEWKVASPTISATSRGGCGASMEPRCESASSGDCEEAGQRRREVWSTARAWSMFGGHENKSMSNFSFRTCETAEVRHVCRQRLAAPAAHELIPRRHCVRAKPPMDSITHSIGQLNLLLLPLPAKVAFPVGWSHGLSGHKLTVRLQTAFRQDMHMYDKAICLPLP